MASLFEEKLAIDDVALQQDKRLADAILVERGEFDPDATRPEVSSQLMSFGPTAAARLSGEARSLAHRHSGALLGLLGLVAVVGTATGTALWMDRAGAASARAHASAAPAPPPACDTLSLAPAGGVVSPPRAARDAGAK